MYYGPESNESYLFSKDVKSFSTTILLLFIILRVKNC